MSVKYKTNHRYKIKCSSCNNIFHTKGKNINRGGGKYCSRKCNPSYQKKFTKAEKARRHNLSSKYGMNENQYFERLILQNGGCKICGATRGNKKHKNLFVDHSHKFGVVRGLLCGNCNLAISLLKDCPETIRAALFYVLTDGDVTPTLVENNQLPAEVLYDYWLEQGILVKLCE